MFSQRNNSLNTMSKEWVTASGEVRAVLAWDQAGVEVSAVDEVPVGEQELNGVLAGGEVRAEWDWVEPVGETRFSEL